MHVADCADFPQFDFCQQKFANIIIKLHGHDVRGMEEECRDDVCIFISGCEVECRFALGVLGVDEVNRLLTIVPLPLLTTDALGLPSDGDVNKRLLPLTLKIVQEFQDESDAFFTAGKIY